MTIRARENVSLLNANDIALFFATEFIDEMPFMLEYHNGNTVDLISPNSHEEWDLMPENVSLIS